MCVCKEGQGWGGCWSLEDSVPSPAGWGRLCNPATGIPGSSMSPFTQKRSVRWLPLPSALFHARP